MKMRVATFTATATDRLGKDLQPAAGAFFILPEERLPAPSSMSALYPTSQALSRLRACRERLRLQDAGASAPGSQARLGRLLNAPRAVFHGLSHTLQLWTRRLTFGWPTCLVALACIGWAGLRVQEDEYARAHGYPNGALISSHPLGSHELRVGDWSVEMYAQMRLTAVARQRDKDRRAGAEDTWPSQANGATADATAP